MAPFFEDITFKLVNGNVISMSLSQFYSNGIILVPISLLWYHSAWHILSSSCMLTIVMIIYKKSTYKYKCITCICLYTTSVHKAEIIESGIVWLENWISWGVVDNHRWEIRSQNEGILQTFKWNKGKVWGN